MKNKRGEGGRRGKQRPLLVPCLLGASWIGMPQIISHIATGQMWREGPLALGGIIFLSCTSHSCASHTSALSLLANIHMQMLFCGPEWSPYPCKPALIIHCQLLIGTTPTFVQHRRTLSVKHLSSLKPKHSCVMPHCHKYCIMALNVSPLKVFVFLG